MPRHRRLICALGRIRALTVIQLYSCTVLILLLQYSTFSAGKQFVLLLCHTFAPKTPSGVLLCTVLLNEVAARSFLLPLQRFTRNSHKSTCSPQSISLTSNLFTTMDSASRSLFTLQASLESKDWNTVRTCIRNIPHALPPSVLSSPKALAITLEHVRAAADHLIEACDFRISFESALATRAQLLSTDTLIRWAASALKTFRFDLRVTDRLAALLALLAPGVAARSAVGSAGAVDTLALVWRTRPDAPIVVHALVVLTTGHIDNVSRVMRRRAITTAVNVLHKPDLTVPGRLPLVEHAAQLVAMCAICTPDNLKEAALLVPALSVALRAATVTGRPGYRLAAHVLMALANIADCYSKEGIGYQIHDPRALLNDVMAAWQSARRSEIVSKAAWTALTALLAPQLITSHLVQPHAQQIAKLMGKDCTRFDTARALTNIVFDIARSPSIVDDTHKANSLANVSSDDRRTSSVEHTPNVEATPADDEVSMQSDGTSARGLDDEYSATVDDVSPCPIETQLSPVDRRRLCGTADEAPGEVLDPSSLKAAEEESDDQFEAHASSGLDAQDDSDVDSVVKVEPHDSSSSDAQGDSDVDSGFEVEPHDLSSSDAQDDSDVDSVVEVEPQDSLRLDAQDDSDVEVEARNSSSPGLLTWEGDTDATGGNPRKLTTKPLLFARVKNDLHRNSMLRSNLNSPVICESSNACDFDHSLLERQEIDLVPMDPDATLTGLSSESSSSSSDIPISASTRNFEVSPRRGKKRARNSYSDANVDRAPTYFTRQIRRNSPSRQSPKTRRQRMEARSSHSGLSR